MFGISEQPRWDHPFPRTGCNLDRHREYIKADRRRRENNRVEMKAPPEPTNAGRANLQVLSKLKVSEGQLFRSRIEDGLPPVRELINPEVALTCFRAKVRTFPGIGQQDGEAFIAMEFLEGATLKHRHHGRWTGCILAVAGKPKKAHGKFRSFQARDRSLGPRVSAVKRAIAAHRAEWRLSPCRS